MMERVDMMQRVDMRERRLPNRRMREIQERACKRSKADNYQKDKHIRGE
jgi:hypothetical protein